MLINPRRPKSYAVGAVVTARKGTSNPYAYRAKAVPLQNAEIGIGVAVSRESDASLAVGQGIARPLYISSGLSMCIGL
jgi:hypothetical protein